ncbi:MAG TPA: sugar ABC transporter permease [Candidatus Limnocylindrales bacterium]
MATEAPARTAAPPMPWMARVERAFPYALLIPATIALLAVSIFPLYQGIEASFTQYVFGRPRGSAGFDNYVNVFTDATFWDSMWTTARFVVIVLVLETVLGVALALLVHRELRFSRLFRMSIIAPMTVAPVAVGVIWRLMYASDTGIVDPLFVALGQPAPEVLSHPQTAFWGLVVVDVWEWTPLLFLLALAGLQSLPQEPLEAAVVDGAGPLRVLREHTIPLLMPVLAVGIVLRLIDAIGTFDQVFVLTRGGPGTATQLISIYAYNTAFNFTQYGQGAAMLVTLFILVFALMMVALRLMRRAQRLTG